jgi:hypothetical protein
MSLLRSRLQLIATGVAILAYAACSLGDEKMPTGPAQVPTVSFGLSDNDRQYDANGDGRLDDAEKEAKEQAKKAAEEQKKRQKAWYDSLKADWSRYKKRVAHGERVEFLRCEPRPYAEVSKQIGPRGGTLRIGPHQLTIPPGALDAVVTITGRAPTGPVVDLQFEPHGLEFKKPVEMAFDYKGCIVPDDEVLGVVYVSHGRRVLEEMPSTDNRPLSKISALTDHFSGYMVSSGRR